MSPKFDINDFKKNNPDKAKLSTSEKMSAIFVKIIIYLGIVIGIIGTIYIIYRFLPQLIDFAWSKIVQLLKKDYPNVK